MELSFNTICAKLGVKKSITSSSGNAGFWTLGREALMAVL